MSRVLDDADRRFIYGRRRGPKLKPGQRRRLANQLPAVEVALPPAGQRLEPGALRLPGTHALWLEIGFGGGEHLAWQAVRHPHVTHLGVEPYLNGVASLLARLEEHRPGNVRVVVDDARLLLRALPSGSLERIAVLFPDPWPKARHQKRRIVNERTIAEFARLLRPGSELRLASDFSDYVTQMLAAAIREPALAWLAERADDWRTRPLDWPPTRYEEKARAAGRRCTFLRFRRLPLP